MIKRITAGAAIGLATLSGCNTAEYRTRNIQRMPQEEMKRIAVEAEKSYEFNPLGGRPTSVDYFVARRVAEDYERAPKQDITVVFNGLERRLNMTGPINSAVPVILMLEGAIPNEYEVRNGVEIGDADRQGDLLSRSGDNRFSNESGLLAVDYFVSPRNVAGKKEDFAIFVSETTRLKEGNANSLYESKIVFGVGEHLQSKDRTDPLYLAEIGRNAGIGGIFAGWPGAAVGVGISVVDGLVALAEGANPPSGTILNRDLGEHIGSIRPVAEVKVILEKADRLSATHVILHRQEDNLGVAYVKNPIFSTSGDSSLVIHTTADGASNLGAFLYGAAQMAGAAYILSLEDCDNGSGNSGNPGNGNIPGNRPGNGGVSGGQIGGPGAR